MASDDEQLEEESQSDEESEKEFQQPDTQPIKGRSPGDTGQDNILKHQDDNDPQESRVSADGEAKKAKKKKKKALPPIRINLANCKYEVLRLVQRKLGWKEVGDDEDWEIYWTDTSVGIERIMKLSKTQKINHFNGMLEICRKKAMARNLQKMQKLYPDHFDFFPRTFLLPNDLQDLLADVKARGKKQVYILKPDAGCQGKGIRLIMGGKEEAVHKVLKEMDTTNVVAQHYLHKPYLIHGYKFDMRIYALVLSCDPLRVFIFYEGLARFCTEKYSKPKVDNINVSYMHLTNYAVNKHNDHFVAASSAEGGLDNASKWTLAQLAQHIQSEGHDWDAVWGRIQQLIIKSLCSVQPVLRNNYRSVLPPDNEGFSCFEILGYDVMLDSELRPWLIEVNHSPSFNIDSPLDLAIKEELITDTIQLARIDPKLIAKAKKADKRAAAGRLLEPLQKKKPPAAGAPAAAAGQQAGSSAQTSAPGGGQGAAGAAACGADGAKGSGAGPEGSGVGAGGAAGAEASGASAPAGASGAAAAAGSATPGKPKTAEEYEAWRAEIIRKREKYEAKHSGGFSRIFPVEDPKLQGMYDELLRGAAELFSSNFQSKAKRALDQLGEERKKKAQEDAESGAQKAEKAKARAHRDRLAQMAVERRNRRIGADKHAAAAAAVSAAAAAGGYGGVPHSVLPPQLAATLANLALGGAMGGAGGDLFAIAGTQPRSELWGEASEAGYGSCTSPMGSRGGSRPVSARSANNEGSSFTYYYRSANGSGHLLQHTTSGYSSGHSSASQHGRQQQHYQGQPNTSQLGSAASAPPGAALSSAAAAASAQNNNSNNVNNNINMGALPPQPFRPTSARYGDGGGGAASADQAFWVSPSPDPRSPGLPAGLPPQPHHGTSAAALLQQHQHLQHMAAVARGAAPTNGAQHAQAQYLAAAAAAGSAGAGAAGGGGSGLTSGSGFWQHISSSGNGPEERASRPQSASSYAALPARDFAFQYPRAVGSASGSAAGGAAGAASAAAAAAAGSRPSSAAPGSAPGSGGPSLLEKLQPSGQSAAAAAAAAISGYPDAVSPRSSPAPATPRPASFPPAASPQQHHRQQQYAGAVPAAAAAAGPGSPAAAAAAAAGACSGAATPTRRKPVPSIALHEVIQLDDGGWAQNLGGQSFVHLYPHVATTARPLSAGSSRIARSGSLSRAMSPADAMLQQQATLASSPPHGSGGLGAGLWRAASSTSNTPIVPGFVSLSSTPQPTAHGPLGGGSGGSFTAQAGGSGGGSMGAFSQTPASSSRPPRPVSASRSGSVSAAAAAAAQPVGNEDAFAMQGVATHAPSPFPPPGYFGQGLRMDDDLPAYAALAPAGSDGDGPPAAPPPPQWNDDGSGRAVRRSPGAAVYVGPSSSTTPFVAASGFVIRPIVGSSKVAPRGGTLYTSMRTPSAPTAAGVGMGTRPGRMQSDDVEGLALLGQGAFRAKMASPASFKRQLSVQGRKVHATSG